jgi:hypothetical protein
MTLYVLAKQTRTEWLSCCAVGWAATSDCSGINRRNDGSARIATIKPAFCPAERHKVHTARLPVGPRVLTGDAVVDRGAICSMWTKGSCQQPRESAAQLHPRSCRHSCAMQFAAISSTICICRWRHVIVLGRICGPTWHSIAAVAGHAHNANTGLMNTPHCQVYAAGFQGSAWPMATVASPCCSRQGPGLSIQLPLVGICPRGHTSEPLSGWPAGRLVAR